MYYPVKCFFEIYEDMVKTLRMLEVLLTQDSEGKDLFYGVSIDFVPSLLFSKNLFSLGFVPVQDDFQHDFTWIADAANGSVAGRLPFLGSIIIGFAILLFSRSCHSSLLKHLYYQHLQIPPFSMPILRLQLPHKGLAVDIHGADCSSKNILSL